MSARIWLAAGFIIIISSLVATIYYANQVMSQMTQAQTTGAKMPNVDLNAAVYSSFFVGIGFVFITVGLIKHLNKKRRS